MNSVDEELVRAQRAIASARALFREGQVPECHEYMLKALHTLVQAWLPGPADERDADPAAETEQALRALEHARYHQPARLRAALVAAQKSGASSASSTASFPEDAEWLWAEIERLNHFTVRHFRSPAVQKRRRIALGVALGLSLLVCFVFVQRLWGRPYAHASAVFSPEHLASDALDGVEPTEWLLPESTTGWIDVLPPKPRTLHSVRLLNAHNASYVDRATRKLRVTAYSEAGPVGSVEGAFTKLTEERSVLDLPLKAERVVRVRVEVLSFFGRGGGFAEIELR